MSPALAGGFSTTAPPGKSQQYLKILDKAFKCLECKGVFVNVGFNFSKGMVATWLKSMKSPGKKKVTFS